MRSDGLPDGWLLLPQKRYLVISDDAIYDYLALAFYWARGRI